MSMKDLLNAFDSIENIEEGFTKAEERNILKALWSIPSIISINSDIAKEVLIIYKDQMYAVTVPFWRCERDKSTISLVQVKWYLAVNVVDHIQLVKTKSNKFLKIDLNGV